MEKLNGKIIDEYKLYHLGGRTRGNEDSFRAVEKAITFKYHGICFTPTTYDYGEYVINSLILDDMCYAKLLISDVFVIATPWGSNIGESTKLRINQCKELGIPVMVYNFEKDELELYEEGKRYAYREYGHT